MEMKGSDVPKSTCRVSAKRACALVRRVSKSEGPHECGGYFDPEWFDLSTVDKDLRNAMGYTATGSVRV
jgi:hypothetical protein